MSNDIFQILLSDRVSTDLCLYFDSLITDKDNSQLQLFDDTKNLKSNFSVQFNKKTWYFDVASKHEHFLEVKKYHTESGNKFPEIVEYFKLLSEGLTQSVNYFQFDYIDQP